MRLTRKLALLTTMALAAMALAATNATAQESAVEVLDEASLTHCNPTAKEPTCDAIHAVGSSELRGHTIFGEILASQCNDEFTAQINEDGTGHIYQISLTGANCERQPCTTAGEDEWPITGAGETGPNVGHMHVDFCLRNPDNGNEHHCHIEVQVSEPSLHHYTISANTGTDVETGTDCPENSEVVGSWETEESPAQEIEIVHQ